MVAMWEKSSGRSVMSAPPRALESVQGHMTGMLTGRIQGNAGLGQVFDAGAVADDDQEPRGRVLVLRQPGVKDQERGFAEVGEVRIIERGEQEGVHVFFGEGSRNAPHGLSGGAGCGFRIDRRLDVRSGQVRRRRRGNGRTAMPGRAPA